MTASTHGDRTQRAPDTHGTHDGTRLSALALLAAGLVCLSLLTTPARAQNAVVFGDVVHTMAGEPIPDGVVIILNGRIAAVGSADSTPMPAMEMPMLRAPVVVPGFIDAHTTVGLTGWTNQDEDQDQFDATDPIQPELRALDSYNARDPLVSWLASLGVTTVHTGHAPGAVISGQTLIAKTRPGTVEDAVLVAEAMVCATLGDQATVKGRESPGTRSKAAALLRQALVDARAYAAKRDGEQGERPDRDLRKETLARVLSGELPLLVTAQRHHDISTALRLADEFGFRLVLDGAAEAHQLLPELAAAGVPVLPHPMMVRAWDSTAPFANASYETPRLLLEAGIPMAQQSGFEDYVPKVRVLPLEAAIAGRWGLSWEDNLASITREAAVILGVDDRIGTLEVGKHGDVALFDGDPFEYATHCLGTVIEGEVVSDLVR